jgi:hypothetical protein
VGAVLVGAGLPANSSRTVLVQDGELLHGCCPIMSRHSPLYGDVADRQPQQLSRRVVIGEVPPGLDDLAQLRIHTLDRVGGVDHFAYRRWENKKGNHLAPDPLPCTHHHGVLLAPAALCKVLKRLVGGLRIRGGVKRSECSGQSTPIFPAGIAQAIADQMHDAGLQRRGGEHRSKCLLHTFEAVGDCNQDVLNTSSLQLVEDS